MFTIYHFIWLAICIILIVGSLLLFKLKKFSLNTVLTIACVICVLSEVIKTFSVINFYELPEGGLVPYIKMQHLPLHLCSIQIIFIFLVRIMKKSKIKDILLSFMYPTCILGAFFALLLPSIFTSTISVEQAFTHPLAYQFFIYHSMLIILGIYIVTNKEVEIKGKYYFSSLGILGVVAFFSFYINSIFSNVTYSPTTGMLESVNYTPNFFFTFQTPINLKFTAGWQWYVYIMIILVLAFVLLALFYLPFFIKDYKKKKEKNNA